MDSQINWIARGNIIESWKKNMRISMLQNHAMPPNNCTTGIQCLVVQFLAFAAVVLGIAELMCSRHSCWELFLVSVIVALVAADQVKRYLVPLLPQKASTTTSLQNPSSHPTYVCIPTQWSSSMLTITRASTCRLAQ